MVRGKEVEVKKGEELPASGMCPEGLRVLVVDDDPTCLRVVKDKLTLCKYEVTACQHAKVALSMLREKKDKFDLILTDVHMPDMDGFKLLELVGLELDLPVIMMSADREVKVATEGLEHGACYYLMKPICFKELRNIWQHVVRWKKGELKETDRGGSVGDRKHKKAIIEEVEYNSSINEGNYIQPKRKKEDEEGEEEDEEEENENSVNYKKKRLVWNTGLHSQFLNAVAELGFDKAVPKKILALMNVPGLARENVASHLQKYRLYIRRLNDTKLSLSTSPSSSTGAPKSRTQPVAPTLTFGVQDQMAPAEISDHCGQTMPQPGWPGNMQSVSAPMFTTSVNQMQVLNQKTLNNSNNSMMVSSMYNPPLMDGPTNFQQSHLQQQMEELSVGDGTLANQMRMNLRSLYDESIQMSHQQEEAQSGLLNSYQVDNLNMPNVQGHSDLSTVGSGGSFMVSNLAQDCNYTGLMMNSSCGLSGLTLSDSVAEPSNNMNATNIQMSEVSHGKAVTGAKMKGFLNPDFSAMHHGYANEGTISSGRFANDKQTLERLVDPVRQQNDFTRGYFQKAVDGDSFLLDLLKNSSFLPQFEEADIGDSLSKQQQPAALQFVGADFDNSSFRVDDDDGAE